MKFLRGAIPNLAIALNISLLFIVYLDQRNPMMGFLMGTPFLVLVGFSAAASIVSAGVLYRDWRKSRRNPKSNAENIQKNPD